jgi:hypothetical protein
MNPDPRCCGSGTCIIDVEGHCWCGQRWDGEKMVTPGLSPSTDAGSTPTPPALDPDVAAHP